jgi:uncharacterized membrane protein YidH (DUF202 family)
MTPFVGMGVLFVAVGLYGYFRVSEVKPRSPRPELAANLYFGFGLIIALGLAILAISVAGETP